MQRTRREFLTSALVACGGSVPLFLARSARALSDGPRDNRGRVLVVVQLDGGNDGLNTVVPYADPDYRKHRPKLQIPSANVLKIDDRVGFHPALGGFAKLLEEKKLAVVQGVGYPNPNRSHFESMATWHTARLGATSDTPGWLARFLDRAGAGNAVPRANDAPALHVSTDLLPQALYGGGRHVPSLSSLEQFRRRLGLPEGAAARRQRQALDALASGSVGRPGSLLEFVERSTLITYASSARLEEVADRKATAADYPDYSPLGRRLRLIAQLIQAGLTTSIYYTQLDGFDTHSNQPGTHDGLLRQVGDALKAFMDDLSKSGDGGRVAVLVFSEFGRRLAENASQGTDHGTAAPVFVLGAGVKPGVHGPYPNLQDLDDGDPKFGVDFRRVYAALLGNWLGRPAAGVLGEEYEPYDLF
jgi:uncharacterized protein (DUF1501 family)